MPREEYKSKYSLGGGGVIVFSDPANYPSQVEGDPKWKTVVGIHLTHAGGFNHQQLGELVDLLTASPNAQALGEVGLDRTTPSHTWGRQEEVLQKVLKIPSTDQKSSCFTCLGTEMIRMDRMCKVTHLHSFTGEAANVNAWFADFLQAYFSVNTMVEGFDRGQREGLRSVSKNRLLLETDAPHLSPGGEDINTPHRTEDVAVLVARARGTSLEEVLYCSTSNARAIYRIP
ncbi:putative deoxyribonuclease tatdn3-B [Haliotis rufescens]|uniref:putative deoxyribonuclease tatdn3-B n=1 Tax=Haliotis rufescens TaxID=6454 RepID=UPI00201FAB66|nr:putative deoxyribonuclease tatdn3-B [Haliotis rufescens]